MIDRRQQLNTKLLTQREREYLRDLETRCAAIRKARYGATTKK